MSGMETTHEPNVHPLEFSSASLCLTWCIQEAYKRNASDIHIDPTYDRITVRFRVDGILCVAQLLPRSLHASLLSRIKILSGLRTDEHFISQDGRFRFEDTTKECVDVRVSIAPTYHGENAVLRLLKVQHEHASLQTLGCRKKYCTALSKATARTSGLILATGPTGSGKTTLLYSLLQTIDATQHAIVTLEDPIEYSLEGIRQIPIRTEYGLSFSQGLRSVLRQDPDVLMIGEIRDTETARLAIQTALTGHLVLSTLHTTDAPSAIARLSDLGIEPYLLASTLHIVIAQRLVRRICTSCCVEQSPSLQLREHMRGWMSGAVAETDSFYIGAGCDACNGTGYQGRVGMFELLTIDDVLSDAISKRLTVHEIRTLAFTQGMESLAHDGLQKARKGITSLEEVMRVTLV